MLAFLIILGWLQVCILSLSLSSMTIKVPARLAITPLSLRNLLKTHRVKSVQMLMGHLISKAPHIQFPESIIAKVQTYDGYLLEETAIAQIAASFMLSNRRAFQFWDGPTLIMADPNDKPCTQHIEYLLKVFFPCRTFADSKILNLLSVDRLTAGFLGIKFLWQPAQTTMQIVSEASNNRGIVSFKSDTACGFFQFSPFEPSQVGMSLAIQRPQYSVISLSRWYSPPKTIALIIKQCPSVQLGTNLTFLVRLPVGFTFDSLSLHSEYSPYVYSATKSEDNSYFIRISVDLPLLKAQMVLHINFRADIPSFETFEVIAGGGQELMILSMVQGPGRNPEIYTHRISEQLLQPDFSINFQVITGYAAVILLVWLTLWRQHSLRPLTSTLEDCQ